MRNHVATDPIKSAAPGWQQQDISPPRTFRPGFEWVGLHCGSHLAEQPRLPPQPSSDGTHENRGQRRERQRRERQEKQRQRRHRDADMSPTSTSVTSLYMQPSLRGEGRGGKGQGHQVERPPSFFASNSSAVEPWVPQMKAMVSLGQIIAQDTDTPGSGRTGKVVDMPSTTQRRKVGRQVTWGDVPSKEMSHEFEKRKDAGTATGKPSEMQKRESGAGSRKANDTEIRDWFKVRRREQ